MQLETTVQAGSSDSAEPTGGTSRGRCMSWFQLVLGLNPSNLEFLSLSPFCVLIGPSDDRQQEAAVETSSRPGTISLVMLFLLLLIFLLLLPLLILLLL